MKQDKPVEQVLAVRASSLWEIGYFNGICYNTDKYIHVIQNGEYVDRPKAETDPSYKQIVVYAIFANRGKIFSYLRGGRKGESRLKGKKSIGIGGHVSRVDVGLFREPYFDALKRELQEEVNIESSFKEINTALINDDSDEVGKVHLGVVHIFEMVEPKINHKEKSMKDSGFLSIANLKNTIDDYEGWSKLCISNIDVLYEKAVLRIENGDIRIQ